MPDNETLSEALRWLRYAREDLDSARMMAAKEDVPARHVCWFAQQAAEKAIKAVHYDQGARGVIGHNVRALVAKLSPRVATLNALVDAAGSALGS